MDIGRMKRKDFENRIRLFKVGDYVKLDIRGNYGRYRVEGRIRNIRDGRICLDKGFSHSYRKIINIIDRSTGRPARLTRRCRRKPRIHFEILRAVRNGEHLQSRIIRTANVRHAYFKTCLKELVEADLVRLGEPSERRAQQVYLTPKGAEYVELGQILELENRGSRR